VVAVFGLARPTTLAGGLTGVAASRSGAVFLVAKIAVIGGEEDVTMLAFPLSDAANHDLALLGSMIRNSTQNGEENGKEKKTEEEGRIVCN